MPNSSSPEPSDRSEDNSYNSDSNTNNNNNHNNNNNNNNSYNENNSESEGNNDSDNDSDDDKPLASKLNASHGSDSDDNDNNGNDYDSESHSQSQSTNNNNNSHSSQSIKRERSDSDDDSDNEPLSKKLSKSVKKEDSDDEYSPKKETKVKTEKKEVKKEPKKEPKSKKRKKESDYDSEYNSEDEDYGRKKSSKKKSKSYSDDDDDDYKDSKSKKKAKSGKNDKKSDTKKKSVKKEVTSSPEKSPTKKKVKKEENEEHIWKWWEEERPGEGIKWKTLTHKGPVFPPPYEPLPKSVKFYYDGKPLRLKPEAEEVAGFYARMLDHDYVAKPAFNKNFFKDWRKTMTEDEKQTISDLKKCNFKDLGTYFKEESEKRKQKTKEEKLEIKKQNEKLIEEYGYCIVDGHKQKIGNFRIEPPGLFRGRGEHPKMGKLKKRVRPEDVIINIGKKVEPPAPPAGRKWKEVRHDNTVTWLASWQENVMGNVKYIMLNPSSKLKSIKDWQKYEKARELKKYISKIRDDYRIDFKAREMVKRQRAVALYFIDKLALRAGNEKEEGETADTVGCCSLRVEHIKLHDKKNGKEYVVDFDFLGKDSIRYENSVSVEKRVYKNLKHFMESKKGSDDLFDRIDTAELNRYLTSLMDGLTAKVFRTYNASQTLQLQLNELTKSSMSLPEKILAYNRANRAVALLCNHQRAVPKTFDKQMENLEVKIKDKKKVVKEAKKNYKEAKKNRDNAANVAKFKKRLETLEDQLEKLVLQRTDKEENKQIALGTSKLNYLDPRITVAWCKKWDVNIEKVYNKTQRDKFRWAIEMVGPEYQF